MAEMRATSDDHTKVEIVEVGPRDGLQNDPAMFATASKIELIERCLAAGARRIEVASFVNPKLVPQMADGEAVLAGLPTKGAGKPPDASWVGLVLNERGFYRALETCVEEVNLVVMTTDSFSRRNQGVDTERAISTVERIVPLAEAAGLRVSVAISAAFGCPFEGEVRVGRVVDIAARLAAGGLEEIALADTIGVAVPRDVERLVAEVRPAIGAARLRVHFHNTRNTGYANALAAINAGVRVVDASLGGIGGCPFAPRATGNIATEDLVYLLERSGITTGLDLGRMIDAGSWLSKCLGRDLPALLPKAGGFPASP